jgi:class 3 adenylate cyclase
LERRLAVITSTDLVGFTQLMKQDETGTWEKLCALRKELFKTTIALHNGRIFKATGDWMLAEFTNCSDAVGTTVAIQTALHERYKPAPLDERLTYRVGIDMGDVIVDEDDLIGDAVNVASRFESVCEPGGVCISEAVFKAMRLKQELPFADIGQIELRNRSQAVRSYVWRHGAIQTHDRTWRTIAGVRLLDPESRRRAARSSTAQTASFDPLRTSKSKLGRSEMRSRAKVAWSRRLRTA